MLSIQFLFNFIVDSILGMISSLSEFLGIDLPSSVLIDLEYADDVILLGKYAEKFNLLIAISNNVSIIGRRSSPHAPNY